MIFMRLARLLVPLNMQSGAPSSASTSPFAMRSQAMLRAQALAFARCQAAEEAAYEVTCATHAAATKVAISHYIGGPCHPSRVQCCVVPGGGGCGWTVLPRESDDDDQQGGGVLARALELAHLRASSRSDAQGPVCG